jgi:L-asparaginase / beta-aspartyl-peptidase
MGADMLVGSDNARAGFADGMRILRRGGRALDAVEATIRRVEENPADHSVGLGGLPNILGEVELDASLMDRRTLQAGAVCAVRGYPHVISLAREVMVRLPHVLVAGAGAERLARVPLALPSGSEKTRNDHLGLLSVAGVALAERSG